MAQPAAIIRIKNLRLRTFIGIKEEEINNRQDIVINVTIHYPADKARTSEDINDALNYRTVTKRDGINWSPFDSTFAGAGPSNHGNDA